MSFLRRIQSWWRYKQEQREHAQWEKWNRQSLEGSAHEWANDPATERQADVLEDFGFDRNHVRGMTKMQASRLISKAMGEKPLNPKQQRAPGFSSGLDQGVGLACGCVLTLGFIFFGIPIMCTGAFIHEVSTVATDAPRSETQVLPSAYTPPPPPAPPLPQLETFFTVADVQEKLGEGKRVGSTGTMEKWRFDWHGQQVECTFKDGYLSEWR